MLGGRLFLQNNTTCLHRIFPFLFLFILTCIGAGAQDTDTTAAPAADSLLRTDTATPRVVAVIPESTAMSLRPYSLGSSWDFVPGVGFSKQVMDRHPYYNFSAPAIRVRNDIRIHNGKDNLFYGLLGLVFLFAVLKLAFAKYINDLFRVFFRTTMKQRQIREQLMQTPLPSLLFNIFFVLTAGMYANFFLHNIGFIPVDHFWMMYLYCCAGVAMIYLVKFIGLKICGWIFNIGDAAESYIFIVFIINKMIGIFLLPVIVLLAFSGPQLYSVVMVLSWCGIGMLLLYRFVLAFSAVRNEVRFNLFHFILYLAAFEVGPLLLIYRVLLSFV